jgi:hypothetical protein
MNLMTIRRYKNEIILMLTLLFAGWAFYYKYSAMEYVQKNRALISNQIEEITAIERYKKQWANKGMAKRVKLFKTIVSSSKVKRFSKKSSKLSVLYVNLTSRELNKITNKLLNMPIQIVKLQIKESSKNRFTMEFTCKW